jgi:hypothetical protein
MEALNKSWLSLLAYSGTVVMSEEEKKARLVLYTSAYGLLTIRMMLNDDRELRLPPQAGKSLKYHFVREPADWRCADVEVLLPSEGGSGKRLRLRLRRERHALLKHQALHGFRGMGVMHLRRLAAHLGLGGAYRTMQEVELVRALLSHALGADMNQQRLERAAAP